jgi:hypothetical protein
MFLPSARSGRHWITNADIIERVIETKGPFRIKTAGGDVFDIPHRDFIAFTARRTTLVVNFERDDREAIAWIPLLTITSVEAESPNAAP